MEEALDLCLKSFAVAQVSLHALLRIFITQTSLCTEPVIDLEKIGKEQSLYSLIFIEKVQQA